MEMIKDRNRTSHTYNRDTAMDVAEHVMARFFQLFVALKDKMQEFADEDTN